VKLYMLFDVVVFAGQLVFQTEEVCLSDRVLLEEHRFVAHGCFLRKPSYGVP
jgi:hypothetical protein